MTQSLAIGGSGFPSGYFIVKSIASGRVLDVLGDGVEDGTDVALWPEKGSSLVESEDLIVVDIGWLLSASMFRFPES